MGLAGMAYNHYENEANKSWQGHQNEEDRKFQAFENEKNRWFQRSERIYSQEYQEKMANLNHEWYLENRNYNSPVEQAKRLNSIGLSANGSNIEGQSTFSMPSTPSAPSAPSTNLPSGAHGSPAGITSGADIMVRSLSAVGGFIKDISQSGFTDAQKMRTNKLLEGELVGQMLDNQYKAVSNIIQQNTGLKRAWAEIAGLSAQALLADEQKRTEIKKQVALKMQAFADESRGWLDTQEYIKLVMYCSRLPSLLDSMIASNFGSAQQSYSQAALNSSVNEFQKMHNELYKMVDYGFYKDTDNGKIKVDHLLQTYQTKLSSLVEAGAISAWQAHEAKNRLNRAQAYKDIPEFFKNVKSTLEWIDNLIPMTVGMNYSSMEKKVPVFYNP